MVTSNITDSAGNTGSDADSGTKDTMAPPTPSVIPFASNSTTPMVSGTLSAALGAGEVLNVTVNGATYGPAGTGPDVIKNVSLAPDALLKAYQVADIERDSDLARFVSVAEAATSN